MRNGRLNTSKCRGKLQKMEVLYTHLPKCQAHPHNTKKKGKKKSKKCKKRGAAGKDPQSIRLQAAAVGRPLVADHAWVP
jgi:hypothetical protein